MTWFEVYLWTRLDMVSDALSALAILSFIGAISTVLLNGIIPVFEREHVPHVRKALKFTIAAFIITNALWVATPTAKEYAAIVAIPKIVNNESVQELPKLILDKFKEWLEDANE